MNDVNRLSRKEYRRRWMNEWRERKGLNLSKEEKQKRREDAHRRSLETSRKKANTKEGKLKAKYRMLKNRYGIDKQTADELNKIVSCPICFRKFSSTILSEKVISRDMPHVDHDHVTGKVRGVLCGLCNSLLGRIEKAILDGRMGRIKEWLSTNGETGGNSETPSIISH